MKIEKGNLYYSTTSNKLKVSKSIGNGYREGFSDKIAVYCDTQEDWNYVNRNGYTLKCGSNGVGYYDLSENGMFCFDVNDFKINGYHTIKIDEFKKFYPEVKSNLESFKKSFDIGSALDFIQNKDNINPTHYTSKGIQPIDYIEANGLNFNEGCIIKYLTRYKEKNGLEDLKKAKYYLERLIKGYERP